MSFSSEARARNERSEGASGGPLCGGSAHRAERYALLPFDGQRPSIGLSSNLRLDESTVWTRFKKSKNEKSKI